MLLTDITKILRVLLAAFGTVASQDALTQRRVGQIGEVIGAVEDVAEDEEEDSTVDQKRVEEAHDIIHRVAAILAMEEENDGGGGGKGNAGPRNAKVEADTDQEADAGQSGNEPLAEVAWDGTLDGETIGDTVDLGIDGYTAMTFREGSKTVLEGQGWITITADNVDSFGF